MKTNTIHIDRYSAELDGYENVGSIFIDNDKTGNCSRSIFVYDPSYTGPLLMPEHEGKGNNDVFVRFNQIKGKTVRVCEYPSSRDNIPAIIADGLPGYWGEKVLAQFLTEYMSPRLSAGEKVALLGDRIQDNLRITVGHKLGPQQPIQTRPEMERYTNKIKRFVEKKLGGSISLSKKSRWAVYSGGGDQPKLIYKRESGKQSIAKVRVKTSGFDTVRTEYACMMVCADADITVPEFDMFELENGNGVFLSEKFNTDEQGRPLAMMSIASMLPRSGKGEYRNKIAGNYIEIAQLIRSVSADPETDVRELFKRMMMSQAVMSTDNHMENLSMIQSSDGQWRLSPHYDVITDIHSQSFAIPMGIYQKMDTRNYMQVINSMSDAFQIPRSEGRQLTYKVITAAAKLPHYLKGIGADQSTRLKVNKSIDSNLLKEMQSVLSQRVINDSTAEEKQKVAEYDFSDLLNNSMRRK